MSPDDRPLESPPQRTAQLVHVLVHDAKNALSTTAANLAFLQDACDDLPPDASEALTDVVESVRRVRGALDDILLVAQLHADAVQTRRTRTAARELFDAIARALAMAARERDVTLRFEGARPVWLDGDPTLLRRALEIAIEGAVARAPAGSEVVVRAHGAARAVLEISARRAPSSKPPVPPSDPRLAVITGDEIRLDLLQRIVALHHGTAVAVETDGATTLLRIELPLR